MRWRSQGGKIKQSFVQTGLLRWPAQILRVNVSLWLRLPFLSRAGRTAGRDPSVGRSPRGSRRAGSCWVRSSGPGRRYLCPSFIDIITSRPCGYKKQSERFHGHFPQPQYGEIKGWLSFGLSPSFDVKDELLPLSDHSVVSDSWWPRGPWHTSHPCPPLSPGVAQIHVHWVNDATQPSHPLLPPSPPALNLSQPQGVFQSVGSSASGG